MQVGGNFMRSQEVELQRLLTEGARSLDSRHGRLEVLTRDTSPVLKKYDYINFTQTPTNIRNLITLNDDISSLQNAS